LILDRRDGSDTDRLASIPLVDVDPYGSFLSTSAHG
jgi:hypothetical protein